MMSNEMLMLIAFGLVTVLVLAWMLVRRTPGSVGEAQATLAEAAALARVVVAAGEQLHRTGRLPDNDAKFDYALNLLATQFPDIDTAQLTASIEAAVYWLKRVAPAVQPQPAATLGTEQPLGAQGLPMANRGKARA